MSANTIKHRIEEMTADIENRLSIQLDESTDVSNKTLLYRNLFS